MASDSHVAIALAFALFPLIKFQSANRAFQAFGLDSRISFASPDCSNLWSNKGRLREEGGLHSDSLRLWIARRLPT